MRRLWETVCEPLVTALEPRTIVEIGSHLGVNTANLLGYCHRADATLHVIDPAPCFDVEEWTAEHGDRLAVHQATSLEALPRLGDYDAVLIDGDHNWYTVFHELRLTAETCASSGGAFPLVLLHDVGWPYGRRDLYYDPDTIPAEYRQPHRRGGLLPGHSEPIPGRGLNQDFIHAAHEHGPRNGVRTAVEDFLSESREVESMFLPPVHGLGALYGRSLLDNAAFRAAADQLRPSEGLLRLLRTAEAERLKAELDLREHVPEEQARANMLSGKREELTAARARAAAARADAEQQVAAVDRDG